MRQVPEFIKRIWRTPIWRMDSNQKAIYLTFDDGPNPDITPQVLDILDEFGVKANFFCVGENVEKHRDVFEETKRRGHKVGNHTFNHLKGFETSVETCVANVEKANELTKSKLFRPPHGRITLRQVNALKKDYKIIMWDFITYDFDVRVSPETILNEVKKRSRNGSIVVFHDSTKAAKNMLAVLPKAIQFWQDEGYELKLIE